MGWQDDALVASAAPSPWMRDKIVAPKAQAPDTASGVGNAFASGALMNFGDEATAAVRAAAPGFADWMMKPSAMETAFGGDNQPKPQTVSNKGTFDERYSDELTKEREKAKAFAEANPTLNTTANIAGNVAGTVLALPEAATAMGPSLIKNALKLGTTGGILGGIAGAGEGQGGEDRFARGTLGAGLGATTGAALPFLGAAGNAFAESAPGRFIGDKIVSPVTRGLAAALGKSDGVPASVAQSGAVDRLASAMQKAKLDPSAIESKLSTLGPEGMLADTDPQFLRMASGANTLPGQTRAYAKDVLEARDRGAGPRIVSSFEGNDSVPSTYEAAQKFAENRSKVGTEAYGAMRESGLQSSPQMEEMTKIPAVRDALAQIEGDAANTGTTLSPVEVMHRVKQKLNDTAEAAFASGKPINKADMRGLANQWESAFWEANPQAKAADTAYAQAASLPETMQTGRNFLRKGTTDAATEASAPAIADIVARSTPEQLQALRIGATNAARETSLEGTRAARALAQRIDQSLPVQEKLSQIYGPQAESILRRASAEGTFANTSNKILAGSQTAEKTADAGMLGNAGFRMSPSGITARAIEHISDLLQKLTGPNEAVRNEIGKAMLNPNTEANQRILRLAKALMEKRAAGTPIRAGLIEGAASTANQ